ncbi:unnamed protein product, partial [Adineta steineri]
IQIKKNKFQQFAITVAGGNGQGHELNQLYWPRGIFVDNDKSIYIADSFNHRIVKWELNINTGQIFADGNGKENQNNQLKDPTNIVFDKENNSFIIYDREKRRTLRYFDKIKRIKKLLFQILIVRVWQSIEMDLFMFPIGRIMK